jgi:hypothetical protein
VTVLTLGLSMEEVIVWKLNGWEGSEIDKPLDLN